MEDEGERDTEGLDEGEDFEEKVALKLPVKTVDTLGLMDEDREGCQEGVNSEEPVGGAIEGDTDAHDVTLGEPDTENEMEGDPDGVVNLLRVEVALPPVLLGVPETHTE